MNRRRFGQLVGAAAMTAPMLNLSAAAGTSLQYSTFTKPFRDLGFEETADLVAEVGWDGVELPIRESSSHLQPERVEDDLPRMAEALGRRGKRVFIVTTDVTGIDPVGEKVLRTAAKLGIRKYRLGNLYYDLSQPVAPQLAAIKPRLRELAALNAELGMQGAIQNHSGARYVGAPIWDIHELIHDLDPAVMGICFDIGHATLEGGSAWELNWRLMRERFTAVFVKDFAWEKKGDEWKPRWCPLGDGTVNRRFFKDLLASGFSGIVNQHHEYEHGTGRELIAHCKRDLATLKKWLVA
ncbi:MAG TPA: sugar phosphate isomerase/epimerase [Verrucomicrobiales bacterium]|nr:sugar phosphate isomerase/epimerase [Verrucomicrobiales bacterium]